MKSIVIAGKSAAGCVVGRSGNVKIARSARAMNVGNAAGNLLASPIFTEWKEITIP